MLEEGFRLFHLDKRLKCAEAAIESIRPAESVLREEVGEDPIIEVGSITPDPVYSFHNTS